MTKIFMKLLKQLVKNVPPLIKKHYYSVHMAIFRLFLFSIPVQELKKKKIICCFVYLVKRLS